MRHPARLALALFAITAAAPANLLPLKEGIYVPAGSKCRGASRAEMVNYWGGRSSIGNGMATCEITKVSHTGTTYTYTDICTDIASGEKIDGSTPTVLTIASPTSFRMGDGKDMTSYTYCGPRPQL